MARYPNLWKTKELEEERSFDACSVVAAAQLRQLWRRNDIELVLTSGIPPGGIPEAIHIQVWWRPQDARGHFLPAAESNLRPACDEYYVCTVAGVQGGPVLLRGNGRETVMIDGQYLEVISGKFLPVLDA